MLAYYVLTALVLVAGTGDRTGRIGAVVLAVLGLVWYMVSSDLEGWVLYKVTPAHGFVGSDLVMVVAFGLAAWRWVTAGQKPSIETPRPPALRGGD